MPDYDHEALQRIALKHADTLCEHLAGEWHRTEAAQAAASIARDGCELHLWGYTQGGTARLSIQAQLPAGWGAVEGVTPPEITVSTDLGIESIATDIARRLLPVHAELAARVRDALEREEQRQAVSASIIDHFRQHMPGAIPDLHHPSTAVSSGGPDRCSVSLRLSHDARTANLHLRNTPIELVRGLVDLTGRHLSGAAPADGTPDRVLDDLAEAITALASARHRIGADRLLRETALNLLILGRIASNRLGSGDERERVEEVTDQLVTALRRSASNLPVPPKSDSPTPDH